MDSKNLIIGGALLVMTGISWWIAERSGIQEGGTEAEKHTPDYYLEGMTTIQMDEDGIPEQELWAERMTHYPDDDSTELIEPRLKLYDEEKPPWRLSAKSGWISGDGELVLLNGKVKIDRSAAPNVKPIHIVTRDLRIQQDQNYAETDAEITIRTDTDRMEGRGMQAWFNEPVRLKLLANVRGRYEANN
ncbi:LPS export ABC transporter periplasmic protein LptC [Solemya velesiana gill symbiont]|uniref:LPS export ABC transporter periplasmic protein LptC n=1 Tax=Solemya velesiana gill symbiont TaxID=1918948 RepID=A0A1T2KV92_9GAMM|nr:LPS export ABC transporter periplasmic protein LptC [Solemya velesiana gill symbiont]OOZ36788.1 LPS export ABC transporter periplasmic protein LptC [Solemya velesiana gill symbiont]